jgi:TatA/E family protein of Tat protein translocase
MGNIGVPELIIIFILALILFGPKKLPELGRTLGKALGEFRKASADMRMAMQNELSELERHTQELEAKGHELVGQPAAAPDAAVGSGTIEPQPDSPEPPPTPVTTSATESQEVHPGEKPADGEPRPA